MLKITLGSSGLGAVLKLEGKLAGPWVRELEKSWYEMTTSGQRAQVTVDLSGVNYVDAQGRELLAWICRRGAGLRASGYMMKCLVEEIKRGSQIQKGPRRL